MDCQAGFMKLAALYSEGCRDVSQSTGEFQRGTDQSMQRWGRMLRLPLIHFSDSFGWDAECSQEVAFELVAIRLDGNGSLHAQ